MNTIDWISAASAKRRDRGVRRSVQKAEDKSPGFSDRVIVELRVYLVGLAGKKFLAENFVTWLGRRPGFESPPDGRAFGAVFQRAAREGLIVKDGFGYADSSNGSIKPLWRAA